MNIAKQHTSEYLKAIPKMPRKKKKALKKRVYNYFKTKYNWEDVLSKAYLKNRSVLEMPLYWIEDAVHPNKNASDYFTSTFITEQCKHLDKVFTIDQSDQKCYKCTDCGEYHV